MPSEVLMIETEDFMMPTEDSLKETEDSVKASQGLWNGEKSLLRVDEYFNFTTLAFLKKNRSLQDDKLEVKRYADTPTL
jgi:hypothetical protein